MDERVALVTGGIGGIGTQVCKRLYAQGRRVVAGYLPGEEQAAVEWRRDRRCENVDVAIVPGDVASFESSAEMVQAVRERTGPVEILVNCAGITRDRTLGKMEKTQWEAVLSTNLDSVFNVTRQVLTGMIEQGFGRIVSISSVNGQKGQFGQTNYCAAKAGIHGFTMALAQEVAAKGITVNTVSPGYVDTNMTLAIPDEVRDAIVAQIPLGRMAEPDEIADAVAFLSADETRYITGANLPVNGGLYMS
ncbi:MAG: beta-ketoacyl-ACP reductase [Gammaproteobacteria bacterium]|nr:MAG: beta-ketoacyl-ACP reductase [Gammaproteobacteria bacterium]